MLITINGQEREVPDNLTIDGLILHLALAPERLAVELNREIVRRVNWPRTMLAEGDHVEIVHFVGGGDRTVTSKSRLLMSVDIKRPVRDE